MDKLEDGSALPVPYTQHAGRSTGLGPIKSWKLEDVILVGTVGIWLSAVIALGAYAVLEVFGA